MKSRQTAKRGDARGAPRSLAPENTVRISLVLPTEYAYAREVLKGIVDATRTRSLYDPRSRRSRNPDELPWVFHILRGTYGYSLPDLRKWLADFQPHGVIADIYDDQIATLLADADIPFIELFGNRKRSDCVRIVSDDLAVGAMAAKHFLDCGFRNFAYFGLARLEWSRRREEGFRQQIENDFKARSATSAQRATTSFTFASFGHSAEPSRGRNGHAGGSSMSASSMGAWLVSLPKPVGVFAANDLWGFELVQAARQQSLHVPDDVAILGVDNDESICDIAYPALSSIRLGAEQIGHRAVACMGQLLRGESIPSPIEPVAPIGIITRQSTDVLAVDDADVAALLTLIRRHAVEGMTVKQAMTSVAVNRRTLERRFFSVVGHTPLDEIRRVRIERAKTLLQTTIPIYEVAKRSGFNTPEYLATAFTRAVGVSPTVYRRRVRGDEAAGE